MAENDYVVKLGADAQSLVKSLTTAADQTDKLNTKAKEAGSELNKAMRGAVVTTEQADKGVRGLNQSVGYARQQAAKLADELKKTKAATAGAFDEKPVQRFKRYIDEAKTAIRGLFGASTNGLKKPFEDTSKAVQDTERKTRSLGDTIKNVGRYMIAYFAIDQLRQFGSQIIAISGQFQKFEAVLTNALGSKSAARANLQMISDFAAKTPFGIDELTDAFVKLSNRGFVPTMAQLTALGDLAASQGKSFGQLTEAILDAQTGEFERLKEFGIKAKQSGDQVTLSFKGQTTVVKKNSEEIRNAILAFGELKGVTGTMAVVSETLNGKLSNLSDAFSQLLKNIGDNSGGIINTFVDGLSSMVSAARDYTSTKLVERLQNERLEINLLATNILTVRDNQELRNLGVQTLINKYPEFLEGLNAEKVTNEEIAARLLSVNTQYDRKIELARLSATQDAAQAAFQTDLNTIGRETLRLQKAAIALGVDYKNINFQNIQDVAKLKNELNEALSSKTSNQTFTDKAKDFFGVFRNDDIKIVGQLTRSYDAFKEATVNVGDAQKLAQEATLKLNAEREKAAKVNEDAIKKQGEALKKYQDQLKGATGTAKTDIEKNIAATLAEIKKLQNGTLDLNKLGLAKPTDGKKDNFGKTNTPRGAKEKSESDLQKESNEILIKLAQQLRDQEIQAIDDVEERREREIKEEAARALETVAIERKKITDKKKLNPTDESALILAGQLEVQIRKTMDDKLAAIAKDAAVKRLELEAAVNKEVNELGADTLQKTLDGIDLNTEAKLSSIRKQYAKESDLREKLEAAVENNATRAKKAATDASAAKQLQNEEAYQILLVENMAKFSGKGVQIEAAKQIAILNVQIEYAKKRLELLQGQGVAETTELEAQRQTQIEQAKKAIGDATKSIEEVTKKNGNLGLFEMLGLKEDDVDAALAVIQSTGQIIGDAAQVFIDSIQMQIDAKTKQIDSYQKDVDRLQELADKEQDLADQGLANNVGALNAEIEAKKQLREKELKDREELQKKVEKLQKAQIVADSLTQVSSLVTAAAQVFEAFSAIPFVGVALGAAAVAAMFGFFVASKANALKSVGQTKTYGEGGWIDGKSHAEGGKKYIAADGSGDVRELERDEYVVNKRAAKKYGKVLEAMNKDRVKEANPAEYAFRSMLAELGVRLDDNSREEALNSHNEYQNNATYILGAPNKGKTDIYLASINENINYLAAAERDREHIIEDNEKQRVTRKGNRIRTIKK